jgi:hypothetical protein
VGFFPLMLEVSIVSLDYAALKIIIGLAINYY